MRTQRPDRLMTQDQKEGGMRAPHRRDISARQDLLGKELRQLFDDYTQEDMPDELMKLAAQLQGAFESTPAPAAASPAAPEGAVDKPPSGSRSDTP